MEDNSTYRAVRIDDTADWRLIIYISKIGMSAYLKNEENPVEPLITLFDEKWQRENESLLRRIESIVYDNPQLLDDFSTEIIINTEKSIWVPRVVLEEPDRAGEYRDEFDLFNVVYKADEEDIFIDETGEMVCLYTLTPGLNAFIRRTLPGARCRCQQTLSVRHFMDKVSDMPRLYVDIRDGEADYYAFDGRRLLLAVTHPWRDRMEIAYQILNISEVWNLDMANTQVMLSGKRDVKTELMTLLRKNIQYVMLTMLPSSISKSDLPLAVGLVLNRR